MVAVGFNPRLASGEKTNVAARRMKPPIPKWFSPAQGVAPRRHIPIIPNPWVKTHGYLQWSLRDRKMSVFPWNHTSHQNKLVLMGGCPRLPWGSYGQQNVPDMVAIHFPFHIQSLRHGDVHLGEKGALLALRRWLWVRQARHGLT
jgi:hypothetical protein